MKLRINESYENMFGETLFKFIIGNGTHQPDVYYAYGYNEQDALDVVIDNLEKQGNTYDMSEIETMKSNGDIYDDEYVIGGNHGVALRHYGEFRIETPNNYKDAVKAGILKPIDESYEGIHKEQIKSKKLKEYYDNTDNAELFRSCMNIIEDTYGKDFKTGLQNVTKNVVEEFESYINDEASNFVVDEIYANGDLDIDRYLEEFDNFITFSLRENDINEYDN